jgi:hypothetical protein
VIESWTRHARRHKQHRYTRKHTSRRAKCLQMRGHRRIPFSRLSRCVRKRAKPIVTSGCHRYLGRPLKKTAAKCETVRDARSACQLVAKAPKSSSEKCEQMTPRASSGYARPELEEGGGGGVIISNRIQSTPPPPISSFFCLLSPAAAQVAAAVVHCDSRRGPLLVCSHSAEGTIRDADNLLVLSLLTAISGISRLALIISCALHQSRQSGSGAVNSIGCSSCAWAHRRAGHA